MSDSTEFSFRDLPKALQDALDAVGYESPSPIQAQTIPHLLAGKDLIGHAPTGTGKTAAFALPILAGIDTRQRHVQTLVLTPTRELAIQVAEAFQRYASKLKGFHVLPIYGGSDYGAQLRQLKRGVHVVVGTPGRVMDHMRRGTLKLGGISTLVLDEADEMLRMGFIEDVEWILEQTPDDRQVVLFSATMPAAISRIAKTHLNDPVDISIKSQTATADTIRQRYWQVRGVHKLDALTRILEVEEFDALIIFVRTKNATVELAERLEARGYSAAALNGDMNQKHREQMVERLKKGSLDILVATDVAARGLDVERISHVFNYDIPYDTEAYIHRIGRTGRAGRTGDAILFVAPREKRMLATIERATRQKITRLELPTTQDVNDKRVASFKQKITDTLEAGDLDFAQELVTGYQQEHDVSGIEIAAALAKLLIGDQPLLTEKKPPRETEHNDRRPERSHRDKRDRDRHRDDERERKPRRREGNVKMELFRIEVGRDHDVKPGNIVGAIANEAGLESEYIGHIDIQDDHSFIDLPEGMPEDIFEDLKKVWVCKRQLKISRATEKPAGVDKRKRKPFSTDKPRHKPGSKKPGKKPTLKKKPGGKPPRKQKR